MGEGRGRMGRMPKKDSGKPGGRSRRDSGRFKQEGRRPGKLEMHKIICDKCGKESEVPFKPTSSKPVYCSDCFVKPEGSSGSKRQTGASSEDIAMINMKLDKIMHALKVK